MDVIHAETIEQIHTVQHFNVACLALLIYDWFLTVEQEKTHIWDVGWSCSKVLFLLNRYPAIVNGAIEVLYALIPNSPPIECSHLLKAVASFALVGLFLAEMILLLKVLALYRNNLKVYFSLTSLFLISATVGTAIMAIWAGSVEYDPSSLSSFGGCHGKSGKLTIFADFVIIVLWEIVTITMALWKTWQCYRQTSRPLLEILEKDGIHFFVFALATSITNVALLLFITSEIGHIMFTSQASLHSIFATRMLLHYRSHSHRPETPPFADYEEEYGDNTDLHLTTTNTTTTSTVMMTSSSSSLFYHPTKQQSGSTSSMYLNQIDKYHSVSDRRLSPVFEGRDGEIRMSIGTSQR